MPLNLDIRQIMADIHSFNKDKRRTAVIKLGVIGGNKAVNTLIWVLENHCEDMLTRANAALMLGKLRDQRAVPALIQALDAPGFKTPIYAAQALGKLGDPRAIGPLLIIANSGNDTLHIAARESLKRLGFGYKEEVAAL